ncbi:MAG: hypothetical protein U1F83_05345 [Verrucomicrobiota bacterium]
MSLKDSPAQSNVDGDGQHVNQLVIFRAIDAWSGKVLKVGEQTQFGMLLHPQFEKHKSAPREPQNLPS